MRHSRKLSGVSTLSKGKKGGGNGKKTEKGQSTKKKRFKAEKGDEDNILILQEGKGELKSTGRTTRFAKAL